MADRLGDRETFEAALRCTLCKQGMAESFLKPKQRAALKALVRDKRGLLAILPTGYGKLLVYQLSFSRCRFNVIRGKVNSANSAVLVVLPSE